MKRVWPVRNRRSVVNQKKKLAVILVAVAALLVFNLLLFISWDLAKRQAAAGRVSHAPFVPTHVPPVFTPEPGGYFVYQSFPLEPNKTGAGGVLELLLDNHLTGQGTYGMMALFVKTDINKFKPAVLKTLSVRGKETGRVTLDLPVAAIQGMVDLYGDGRLVYQVDQLIRTEAYIKTKTAMVELKKGLPVELPLALEEDHYFGPGVGNQWKSVPARQGKGMDLLAYHVGPATEPQGDLVEMIFTRFFFDGTQWRKRERKRTVKTEEIWKFPGTSQFP